tara:strand:+ start:11 stop:478 length:468 start_codon:yes stop_codon:yes gene_type:complete
MQKKFFYTIVLLFLSSCGYEAIYSKKNLASFDFSINNLVFEGDRKINIKVKQKLFSYNNKEGSKSFDLVIKSIALKTISAKNAQGDPSIFQLDIKINVNINDIKNNNTETLSFSKKFKYKNNENKIELKSYEDQIKESAAESMVRELTLKLAQIR